MFKTSSNKKDTEPASGDMHGGHVIITGGFLNVHISHVELEKMGQPQLARYPLHWHFCDDVSSAVYEDPTSFESNSIHNTFNRFITVHGTEGALVKDNAGYHTKVLLQFFQMYRFSLVLPVLTQIVSNSNLKL